MSKPDPFVVSLSNHESAPPRQFVLRQAQDERNLDAETFSVGAARLGGLIPRLLGWRPGDFWDATPAELAAILESCQPAGADPLSRSEFEHLLERERHG
jgi:hypothetical protein